MTDEQPKNVNDIIQQDNYDERDEKSKEPTALHPVVAERLKREQKGFSTDTTRVNEPIVDDKEDALESKDGYVTNAELKALEERVSKTVEEINAEFNRIGNILQDVTTAINTISANDKTYKNSFVGIENRLAKILRQMGNIGS